MQQVVRLWNFLTKEAVDGRNLHSLSSRQKKIYPEKRLWGGYYTIISSGNFLNVTRSWDSAREKASRQVASFLCFLNCPVTATLGLDGHNMAALMFFKFVDVYPKLPQKWLVKVSIISSWENMRKHLESASREQTSGKGR